MSLTHQKIFTIPAGMPFAKTLAAKLFEDHKDEPEKLADITVLMPTRRACRVTQQAFLNVSQGRPLILPRLQPIGDIDEEELSINLSSTAGLENFLDLPPAITPLKRQFLLARLIQGTETFTQGFDHALLLAAALGRFMDQIYTENLKLSDLKNIVPEEFAQHWQITLKFLEILSESWPKILKEEGCIDIAERRNTLILSLCAYWEKEKPTGRIIAAGTTGSIPAVAQLLKTISELPQGQIILPGLDREIDEESWSTLDDTHPQFGFKQLLERINIDRKDVHIWNDKNQPGTAASKEICAREIMRPAETTSTWTNIATDKTKKEALNLALQGLKLIECHDEYEEAQLIAILMRETLQTPNKTAALITPDRNLARRVSAACMRWGITLDDSAGQMLNQTKVGSLFKLAISACEKNLTSVTLLSLLKHSLCHAVENEAIYQLETAILRGPKIAGGIKGLKDKLEKISETLEQNICTQTRTALNAIEEKLNPLLNLHEGKHAFMTFLNAHITVTQTLTREPDILWRGEEGQALSKLLSDLLEQAHHIPEISMKQYQDILYHIMSSITIRPTYGTHPRLMILGQLEARLIDADLVIMGGLNEGTWPPDTGHDPWLSRPMRKEFGLPAHERSIGLAAHDFVQGFCSPHAVMTRAKRSSGTITIPARWLQRLDIVLQAAKISQDSLKSSPQKQWAKMIDQTDSFLPCDRPQPRPPISARPTKLSVTRIETWLKDPYGIYARYILKLKPLKPLEQEADAALRGEILHNILDRFIKAHPNTMPERPLDLLNLYGAEALGAHGQSMEKSQFWWPRFERLSTWFIDHETRHREENKTLKTEIDGEIKIQNFTITARADRIDQGIDGAVIIDYKSAGTYSKKAMRTGSAPQLPIEALILEEGGFKSISARPVASIEYWTLSGKASEAGKIIAENIKMPELLDTTKEGLENLIKTFNDEETPYYALPREGHEPRFNDYEHLARTKEWTTLEKTNEAAS